MWTDIIKGAQAILLVGECNFSFTISLLEIVKSPSIITSTCLETDEEEQPRKTNIEFLREKGARILLGIDATKLQEYQNLNNKYDCIIFNFPHVGGKSRIQLNRELLCSFFSSASFCLDEQEKSRIIVTLCQGQGGVPCELPRRQRAYGDTWKVVEMAAYGSLILERLENFQANLFPKYVPSGYGKDGRRGFHVEDSITYIFCKSRPHRIGLPLGNHPFQPETLHGLMTPDCFDTHFGSITCSRVHTSLYHNTPIGSSPISHVLEQLIQESHVQQIINADKKSPLYISGDVVAKSSSCEKCNMFSSSPKKDRHLAKCNVDGVSAYLRDSLMYSLQHMSLPSSMVLVKGHVFHDLRNTFSLPPVGTEAMFTGKGSMAIILHILTKLAGGPGCCMLRIVNENASHRQPHLECIFSYLVFEIISLDQMLVLGHFFCGLPNIQEVCTVNLDNVALMTFSASDWRELRTKACRISLNDCNSLHDANQQTKSRPSINCKILRQKKQIKLIPESLYPPTFIFDVCFSENGVYSETEFWYLLWHLVGDVVISIELLDCYHPPPERIAQGHRTSWCYRLKYRSYEFPLHRKAAVRIQNEVLHWGLVNILGVSVK